MSHPCNPNTWEVTHPHWIWVGQCSEQNAAEITFLISYKIRVVLLWQKVIDSGLRLGSLSSCLISSRWPAEEGWLAGEPELKAPLSVVHGGHTFPECLGFDVKDCVSFHAICWPWEVIFSSWMIKKCSACGSLGSLFLCITAKLPGCSSCCHWLWETTLIWCQFTVPCHLYKGVCLGGQLHAPARVCTRLPFFTQPQGSDWQEKRSKR